MPNRTSSPETAPIYLAVQAIFHVANSLDHLPDVVGATREVAQSAAQLCRRAAHHLQSPTDPDQPSPGKTTGRAF